MMKKFIHKLIDFYSSPNLVNPVVGLFCSFFLLCILPFYRNIILLFYYFIFFMFYEIIILIVWIIQTSFTTFSNVPKQKPTFIERHFVHDQYLLECAEKLLKWHIGNKLQIYLFEPFLLPFADYLENFLLNNFIQTINKCMNHINLLQELIEAIWEYISKITKKKK